MSVWATNDQGTNEAVFCHSDESMCWPRFSTLKNVFALSKHLSFPFSSSHSENASIKTSLVLFAPGWPFKAIMKRSVMYSQGPVICSQPWTPMRRRARRASWCFTSAWHWLPFRVCAIFGLGFLSQFLALLTAQWNWTGTIITRDSLRSVGNIFIITVGIGSSLQATHRGRFGSRKAITDGTEERSVRLKTMAVVWSKKKKRHLLS